MSYKILAVFFQGPAVMMMIVLVMMDRTYALKDSVVCNIYY